MKSLFATRFCSLIWNINEEDLGFSGEVEQSADGEDAAAPSSHIAACSSFSSRHRWEKSSNLCSSGLWDGADQRPFCPLPQG